MKRVLVVPWSIAPTYERPGPAVVDETMGHTLPWQAGIVPTADLAARARGLRRTYGPAHAQVHALAGVDLDIEAGRFTAIMGPSGSGKSTLLHCLAGLDAPDDGVVEIAGRSLAGLGDKQLTLLRREQVGFVFQSFNLVPTLTAEENIRLPLRLAGGRADQDWFDTVVDSLDLRPRLRHRPAELSGGQQQRVACARALLGRPAIVFADEPTGNLDSVSGAEVLSFLRRSVDEFGQTVVLVTHDPVAAAGSDRVVVLRDGRVVDDLTRPSREQVLAHLAAR
jgi:putative ABC transport system ATP-binding protein